MASILTNIRPQFFDNTTGAPLALGYIETYAAGTSTPKVTYQDSDASVPNLTTITLTAAGVSPVDIRTEGLYKFLIYDVDDNLIDTIDDVGDDLADVSSESQLGSDGATTNTVYTLLVDDYVPGSDNLDIYVNGLHQELILDYTETSSTVVTFTSSLEDTDNLVFKIRNQAAALTSTVATTTTVGGIMAHATGDLDVSGAGVTTLKDDAQTRSNAGLEIGVDVQAYDAELAAIAGLTSAADKGIQFTGDGTASTYDLTTAGKALLDDADAAAQRTTLGLGALAVLASVDASTIDDNSVTADELNISGDGVIGQPLVSGGDGSFLYGMDYFKLAHQVGSGGSGGGSSSANTWNKRTLTEITDSGSVVSVTSSTFTLEIGIYFIQAYGSVHGVNDCQSRIRKTSGTPSTEIVGIAEKTRPVGSNPTGATGSLTGILVVTDAADTYELHSWTEDLVSNTGLGNATSGTGEDDEFCSVIGVKIA